MKKAFKCAVVAILVLGISSQGIAAVTSAGQMNEHSAQNGADHAFNWSGDVENTPLKFYYNEAFGGSEGGEGQQNSAKNGADHAFQWSGDVGDTPLKFYYHENFGGLDDLRDIRSGDNCAEHAFKWSGGLEETPFKFSYSLGADGENGGYKTQNGLDHAFNWAGDVEGTPLKFYCFAGYGTEEDVGARVLRCEGPISEGPNMVPEPGTVLLLGLGSICMLRRRKA